MVENVSKLKILSYSDPKMRVPDGFMDVMLNPDGYQQRIQLQYSEQQAPGTTGRLPKFAKKEPDKIDFELLFDRTGVVNGMPVGALGVDEDLTKLKRLTVEYKGEEHRPRFVSIYWGTLKFDGCLETMDISYTLFNPQGLPLRAVVQVSFIGSIEDEKRLHLENSSSPDLTHVRTVKAGDTLPLMCHRIYGDSKYYLAIAAVNELTDFRNLKEGSSLRFPPIAQ